MEETRRTYFSSTKTKHVTEIPPQCRSFIKLLEKSDQRYTNIMSGGSESIIGMNGEKYAEVKNVIHKHLVTQYSSYESGVKAYPYKLDEIDHMYVSNYVAKYVNYFLGNVFDIKMNECFIKEYTLLSFIFIWLVNIFGENTYLMKLFKHICGSSTLLAAINKEVNNPDNVLVNELKQICSIDEICSHIWLIALGSTLPEHATITNIINDLSQDLEKQDELYGIFVNASNENNIYTDKQFDDFVLHYVNKYTYFKTVERRDPDETCYSFDLKSINANFLKNKENKSVAWGFGKRVCPGKKIGKILIKGVLYNIFKSYKIKKCNSPTLYNCITDLIMKHPLFSSYITLYNDFKVEVQPRIAGDQNNTPEHNAFRHHEFTKEERNDFIIAFQDCLERHYDEKYFTPIMYGSWIFLLGVVSVKMYIGSLIAFILNCMAGFITLNVIYTIGHVYSHTQMMDYSIWKKETTQEFIPVVFHAMYHHHSEPPNTKHWASEYLNHMNTLSAHWHAFSIVGTMRRIMIPLFCTTVYFTNYNMLLFWLFYEIASFLSPFGHIHVHRYPLMFALQYIFKIFENLKIFPTTVEHKRHHEHGHKYIYQSFCTSGLYTKPLDKAFDELWNFLQSNDQYCGAEKSGSIMNQLNRIAFISCISVTFFINYFMK
jgi:hypothetical protein